MIYVGMKEKIAELINVVFGFRKFLLLLALYAIAVVFRVKGLLSGDEMVRLIEPTTIAFIGANGVEHIVAAVKDHYAAQAAPDDSIVPTSAQEADDAAQEGKNG